MQKGRNQATEAGKGEEEHYAYSTRWRERITTTNV